MYFCMQNLDRCFLELPAGQVTEFLVGFSNTGDQDMVVEALEASLR